MKSLSLKLPPELHSCLAKVAQERGTTKSDVIRAALEAYFSEPHNGRDLSCADLAADLIGSVKGPADLATNPKHLRGYGK